MASPLGVYFLDVGQGDCSFIVPPDGASAVLFDCNDAYVASRFVSDHGITHLTAAVVSHLDVDHIRGMLRFLRSFLDGGGHIDALYVGLDGAPDERLKVTCSALLEQALEWEAAGTLTLCSPTRELNPKTVCEGSGWSVDVVLPYYRTQLEGIVEGDQPNRCSAVLRVTYGGIGVLIGGDAPLSSWSRLDDGLVKARVIRTPHHGGEIRDNGGDFGDLYDRVGAEVSVFSVGTNNGDGHPDEDHVAGAHRAGGCRILCTQLTPRCHERPEERLGQGLARTGEVAYAYRHRVPRPGRALEVPCAGAMTVILDGSGGYSVVPSRDDWHDAFVATLDTPMCQWAQVG
ncbi:ComEC/Rec2 family competence protein [Sorangium sp. So ce1128]